LVALIPKVGAAVAYFVARAEMQQIAQWLEKIGLSEYAQRFADNGIDVSVLQHLTDQDLKDIGVLLGHRRKLLAAIRELAAAAPVPAEAAARSDSQPEDTAERRQVTVMFSDMVGSTALSARMDPEDLRDVISAYQKCVAETVHRFGGFVAKYMGDGVLVYFGYPEAHEDDAERAARAGLELIAAVAGLKTGAPLQTRVGIATGLVVVGDLIGSGEAQERGIVGETPNLAARLQGVAEPNMVVIAQSTRRLLGSLFVLEDLGARNLKGIAGPVPAWAVLRASTAQSRFEALHSGATSLVGREQEIDVIKRHWQSARAGEGRVVLLSAEPGIGKSRLVAALTEMLQSEPHATFQYFCSPHRQDSALFPVIAGLERAAGFEHSDTSEAKFDKLEALVTQGSKVAEDVVLFAELLSLPLCSRYAPINYSPQRKKEKTLDAVIRHLTGAAERQPVFLIFEDIHWIDPTSRELLDSAVQRIEQLPIFLIATLRPEFRSPWAGQSQVTTLTLAPLAQNDSAKLVRQIERGTMPLPDDLVQEIVARSDGVPLFLEEVTRAVLEAAGADALRPKADVSIAERLGHAVPTTLHASLIARLDRIGSIAKEIAQVGAAIGREFSYEFLAATSQRSPSQLKESLARLVEAGLVFQRGTLPQATFLFKHALVQDAAYSTLLRGARRNLHAHIADALLAVSQTESVAPEIVALHMQSAERPAEAIVYWQKAGEQSVRHANNREAVAHFHRALSLLEAQPQTSERWRTELTILSQLGPALMSVHGWAAAEVGEVVERAADVGRRLESSQELVPSIANLWIFHYANGRLDAAEKISEDLLRIARELNSPEVLLQAHHTAWPVRWGRGALTEAVEHIDAGLALYDEERHAHHRYHYLGHDPAVCGLAIASQLHSALGHPTRARDMGNRALTLARRLKHEPTLAHGLWFVIESQMTCRDIAAVAAGTAELVKLAEQYGLPLPLAMGLVYRGWALACSDKAVEGLELAEQGITLLERSGHRIFLSRGYSAIADIYLMLGRYADGLRQIEKALRIASDIGESFYLPRLFQIRAGLMQASGQADEVVEASLRRSLELAIAQGAKVFELRAAIGLVGIWRRQGKRKEGRDLLTSTCNFCAEGHDMPDFKEATALLDELGSLECRR
jgi:class 3 adenylate cyclase/tetratricopeptide (TPR) repeat protein